MNGAIFILLFLPLLFVLLQQKKHRDWMHAYLNLKYGKEHHVMKEAAIKFLNKTCMIYLLSGEVKGILREVTDHSLLIESGKARQILNLDFVMRIQEIPEKKR